jgi:hypothetical protein
MKMHLGEDQITAAVAGLDLEPDMQRHLDSCLSCRRQVTEMKGVIDARRQELLSGEPDWEHQREQILTRLPGVAEAVPSRKRRWMRPLLAAAAVLLMVIGIRVLWVPGTPVAPLVEGEIAVEEILAEVRIDRSGCERSREHDRKRCVVRGRMRR